MEKEADRISLLPDGILIEILSRLPTTKAAIKTCLLSKRWIHVWKSVPNLIFRYHGDQHTVSDFLSLVHNTLTQCSSELNLNKFLLRTPYYFLLKYKVDELVTYVINRKVQVFTLWLHSDYELEQGFFTASCFTSVTLSCCVLNPTSAITWKNLNSLYIKDVSVDEDLIENILSGSPVLETLVLKSCYGYNRVDITSKSVKNFVLSGYCFYGLFLDDVDNTISINAPNILSLTLQDDLRLSELMLLDVSSLVKADLDLRMGSIFDTTPQEDEVMLKRLILSLRHVKELKIGMFSSRVLFRLEAQGFIFPLNKEYLHISSTLRGDDDLLEFDD